MSEISIIKFDDKTYTITKEKTDWTLHLKKSDAQLRNEEEITLLLEAKKEFLPLSVQVEEDAFIFHFEPLALGLDYSEVMLKSQAEKIRAALNLAVFEQYVGSYYTFFLDPENLQFDVNLVPYIAYRGLKSGLPPAELTAENFLRQYKSIVIALFSKKQTFSSLYGGNLERAKESNFIKTIANAKSVKEITDYLEKEYQGTIAADEKNLRVVSKRKFMTYKQLTIWFSVAIIILLIPLVYLVGFNNPHQAKLLKADTAFLKNDYEQVIQTLQPIATDKIDATQKYELAYAYVQGKDLSDKQKAIIMKSISLKSAPTYLDYWIENGRGNLDKALEHGKRLEDNTLILYGLQQKIEQIKNNPDLSGAEREKQLGDAEADYQKYQEAVQKADEELQKEDAEKANEFLDSSATDEVAAEPTKTGDK